MSIGNEKRGMDYIREVEYELKCRLIEREYGLAKYRLRKMILSTLAFEERKSKLLQSEAWNCWINQNNEHLHPNELTIENIDKEIENVGIRWGMQIEKRYNTFQWIHLAMNEALWKVYIG